MQMALNNRTEAFLLPHCSRSSIVASYECAPCRLARMLLQHFSFRQLFIVHTKEMNWRCWISNKHETRRLAFTLRQKKIFASGFLQSSILHWDFYIRIDQIYWTSSNRILLFFDIIRFCIRLKRFSLGMLHYSHGIN